MTTKGPIRHVAITANTSKDNVGELFHNVLRRLEERRLQVSAPAEVSESLGVSLSDKVEDADLILSLGGDGTLLKTARMVADGETPILGVKTGTLGFLTESTRSDFDAILDRLLAGEYVTESRLRLSAALRRNGELHDFGTALNDVVVSASGARAMRITTRVDDRRVAEYLSDGLIIASPTGSTAYSLAAGGPVVYPSLAALIVTPICPHSLAIRPMVLDANRVFSCELMEIGSGARVTLDGQDNYPLEREDRLEVRRASKATKLVVSEEWDFFRIMRRKLRWGGPRWDESSGETD